MTVGVGDGGVAAARGIIHRPAQVHLLAHRTVRLRYEMVHPILVKAISQHHDQDEGVGCQVGDNVGMASGHGECGNVQRACVQ